MAITWGTAVYDATNGFRCGIEFSQSPSTVGHDTTSVVVTEKLYLGTKYNAWDTGADWAMSNNITASGSTAFNHTSGSAWSASNVTLMATRTRTVSTSFTSTVTTTVSNSITGITAIAGTAYLTGSWSTAKRPIAAPAAPTGIGVSRVSDTTTHVTWSNTSPSDTGHPYQHIEVQRATDDGSFATIATLGVTTSYDASGQSANHKYEYRVRATNTAGASGYTADANIYTTPAAPSNVAAAKVGANIEVTWTDNSPYNNTFEVWHTANGVRDGSALATGVLDEPWTHVSPNASQTHAYEIKSVIASPALTSAFSTISNTVQLNAAPLAPTSLAPPPPIAFDATQVQVFSWQHNPVDTTAQTAYEIQHRVNGGSWSSLTGKQNYSAQYANISANTWTNGQAVDWQVRTWGAYADPSPWSATNSLTLSTAPTATINDPTVDEVLTESSLTVTWGYYDAESTPQSAWVANLYDGNDVLLESRSADNADTSTTFDLVLPDGGSFDVQVAVKDGSGLWSAYDSAPFTVNYNPPPVPTLDISWVPDAGAVSVTIANPVPGAGESETDHNLLYRALSASGPWVLVGEDIDVDGTATDPIPPLGITVYYKAIAISALPSSSEGTGSIATTGCDFVFVNAGSGFMTWAQFRPNVDISIEYARARALHQFAGRTMPVEYVGEARTRTISINAPIYRQSLGTGASTWEEVETVADLPAPACYRDPEGRKFFVSVGSSSVAGIGPESKRSVSWTLTQIDWHEAEGN